MSHSLFQAAAFATGFIASVYEDAMQWALKNQGTRRNLTDEEIKKCEREALMRLGRRYNAEKTDRKKTLKRGNSPKPQAGETGGSTVQKIAKEEGVSKNTVERAGARMEIHDAVEESTPRPAPPCYNSIPAANDR